MQAGAALPQRHQHNIDGDTVQPGGEGGIAAKSMDAAIDLEKRILRELFGPAPILDHAQAKVEDTAAVGVIEQLESFRIAALGAPNGLAFILLG